MDRAGVSRLDEVAARAVPPFRVEDVDGWLARYTPGLATRRVNSVWPRAGGRVEAKLARVEHFYAVRGLPARFQISPAAEPPDLDRSLARRGYEEGGRTSVEVCGLRALARPPTTWVDVVLAPAPTPAWLATWRASLALDAARVTTAAELFGRLRGPVAFAVVRVEGAPAGVAVGVLDGDWLGIFNLATLPAQRRRGVGRAALAALAEWAQARGATTGYLQAELENGAARGLYRAVGFERAYEYAYRTYDSSQPRAAAGPGHAATTATGGRAAQARRRRSPSRSRTAGSLISRPSVR